MKFEVSWKIYLRVNNELKATKLINQIKQKIDLELLELSITKYWKDETLFETTFKTKIVDEISEAEATVHILQLANCLGYRWEVGCPNFENIDDVDYPVWRFEGVCNKPNVSGVHWISFNLTTVT